MSLKAVVDNLDGVDEKYHDLYEEKDGKFVLLPVEGMKSQKEFDVVHTALGKERTDHKSTKTKLSAFGDLDPEQTRTQLARIPELELAAEGKIDEAKIEKIVESRVKGKTAPIERERDALKTTNQQLQSEVEGFRRENTTRKIYDEIGAACKKAKVIDSAQEDVKLLASMVFEVSEDGRVVTKDGAGVVAGVDAESWLSDMQQKRPHWWPASGGGGGRPGQAGYSGENPWKADSWNMTKQAEIYRKDPKKAESMATLAGSKIGAINPPQKK